MAPPSMSMASSRHAQTPSGSSAACTRTCSVTEVEFAGMRQLAEQFSRLVGLAFVLLGVWVLLVNVVEVLSVNGVEDRYAGWILVWILSAGFLGALGGVLFLLSFDGPARFRNRRVRFVGWLGILFLALLPWSFQFVMLPLALLLLPALNLRRLLVTGSTSPKTES